MASKSKWQRLKDSAKRCWNVHIRPKVEPAIRIFVVRKVGEELDKHR